MKKTPNQRQEIADAYLIAAIETVGHTDVVVTMGEDDDEPVVRIMRDFISSPEAPLPPKASASLHSQVRARAVVRGRP